MVSFPCPYLNGEVELTNGSATLPNVTPICFPRTGTV
jgi:hypothetical protein